MTVHWWQLTSSLRFKPGLASVPGKVSNQITQQTLGSCRVVKMTSWPCPRRWRWWGWWWVMKWTSGFLPLSLRMCSWWCAFVLKIIFDVYHICFSIYIKCTYVKNIYICFFWNIYTYIYMYIYIYLFIYMLTYIYINVCVWVWASRSLSLSWVLFQDYPNELPHCFRRKDATGVGKKCFFGLEGLTTITPLVRSDQ